MKNLKTNFYLLTLYFVSCDMVFAGDISKLNTFATAVTGAVPTLVEALIGVALLYFIWGLVLFIAQSGDEKAVGEGKQKMIWGVITLFVLVSVWGLVTLLQTMSGVGGGTNPSAPQTSYGTPEE